MSKSNSKSKPKTNSKIKPSPIKIWADTFTTYRHNFIKLTLLSALVAIPASLLRVVQLDSVTDASIIASFAGFFLTLALYYSFAHPENIRAEKITQIYVQASARILPYILSTLLFSLALLPLFLGVLALVLAISTDISPLLLLGAVVIVLVGLFIAIRLSLATTIAAVEAESSAITALRASWAISKGCFWRLLILWLGILMSIVIFGGIILSLVARIQVIEQNDFALAIVNGILLSVVLPVAVGFATNIYKRLR